MCESSVNVTGSDESWFRLVSLPAFGLGVLWARLHGWFSGWEWCWGWAWWWSGWIAPWGWCWGVFDVYQVHQTTWIWCPYSLYPSGKTDGLERNCFWAVSSLFSPYGLERKCHHDIWASNGLYFSCRLCHWGPGPCTSIHIPIFQSLYQLST